MLCKCQQAFRQSQRVFRRSVHIYSYVAMSKEADFSTALKECMDDLNTNFSTNPSIAFIFSSHRSFQESAYKRLYESCPWLKIGCFVPKIADDSTKHMCISGFLIDGVDKPLTVTKDLDAEKMKLISKRDSPKLLFKSYTSPFYPDISKIKSPTGVITSRNTSLLHDPKAIDTLLCEGGIEKNGVCVEFNKDVFKEQSVEQVFTPLFSVVQPYLCSFNLPFWNGIFSPLQPQMIEVPPPSHLHDLPLMQNIALVFPLTTQTLYLYRPDHIFMLRKYLRSPFIVTPPCQGDAAPQDVGTVCRVESIVSVGEDGSVLCKVRGDERVHVKAQHRVITEMGSVVGDVEEMKDADGEEVDKENSDGWRKMMNIRDKMLARYAGKEEQWKEIVSRYGSVPYQPTLFSFWMCNVLNASGAEKQRWFAMRSTEQRLDEINAYLDRMH
ncbi:hypothetical protein WA577_004271, partial [Blastocystis sp. JDR]